MITSQVEVNTYDLIDYASDWGANNFTYPVCVAKPTNAQQVQAVIQYALTNYMSVSVRATAHSTDGQTLTGGIVLSTEKLVAISLDADRKYITFQSGNKWGDVIDYIAARMPTYRIVGTVDAPGELSVGGTLSLGAVNALSMTEGPSVDHVLSATVVTGDGQIVTASPTQNSDLFYGVLGGLGQFGVIVDVTYTFRAIPLPLTRPDITNFCSIPLNSPVEAPQNGDSLYLYIFAVDSPNLFMDLLAYVGTASNGFDGNDGLILRKKRMLQLVDVGFAQCLGFVFSQSSDDTILYLLTVADWNPKDTNFNGLKSEWNLLVGTPVQYYEYLHRGDHQFAVSETLDTYYSPKAVFTLYVPFTTTGRNWFLSFMDTLDSLNTTWTFANPVSFSSRVSNKTFYQVTRSAESDAVFVSYLYLHAAPSDGANAWQNGQKNYFLVQEFYKQALELFPEAKSYPQGHMYTSWAEHFGDRWDDFQNLKAKYDPMYVLGSSRGIFTQRIEDFAPTASSASRLFGVGVVWVVMVVGAWMSL